MRIVFFLWLFLFWPVSVLAQNKQDNEDEPNVVVLKFSDGSKKNYDIDTYNRIEFFENSFAILSSHTDTISPIEVVYNDCNTIFWAYNPNGPDEDTLSLAIEVVERLGQDAITLQLYQYTISVVGAPHPEDYTLTIYSVDGVRRLKGRGSVNVAHLNRGLYVCVATYGKNILTLKFVR